MFKWIQKIIIRNALKKAASGSALESVADETLMNAVKEMQQTSKTAQKLLHAKMLRAESKKTLEDIANLGDDDQDDDDDDQDPEDLNVMDLIKLFGNKQASQSSDPYAETATENPIKSKVDLLELVKTLSPEQKKMIKNKYGIAL
jgi:hypothetical protein